MTMNLMKHYCSNVPHIHQSNFVPFALRLATRKIIIIAFFVIFLALLDYVSRAHEIKIRPSSVRGVVRLWHELSLNPGHGFLSNFGSCFPWDICPDVCLFFVFFLKKKRIFGFFYEYFSFSLTCDPIRAKNSKR